MVHHAVTRTSWLVLFLLTRCCAEVAYEIAVESFLIPSSRLANLDEDGDTNNPAPVLPPATVALDASPNNPADPNDRNTHSTHHLCASCNKAWAEAAKKTGYRSIVGIWKWRYERRRQRIRVLCEEGVLGMLVSAGVWGLWKGRGVWGWVGVPVGIAGLSFWWDRDWGLGEEWVD